MNPADEGRPKALWFDGQSSRAWSAGLRSERQSLLILPQGGAVLRVARPRLEWLGGCDAPRPILRTPDGGQLLLPSREFAVELGLQPPQETLLRRTLATTPALMVALFLWLTTVVFLVGWVLPPAADWASMHLPPKIEKRLGAEALRAIDGAHFAPSELSEVERARITQRISEIARATEIHGLSVEFRKGNRVGADALAVPGGVVILTDELVALLGDSPRLDAVVAHELGHLHAKHGLRKYLRHAGLGLLFVFVLPDPDMAQKIAERFAREVFMAGHSRDAEREADAFAQRLLEKTGRSSDDLAEALRLLAAKTGADEKHSGFLSSHPGIGERIEAAKGKAAASPDR